MEHTAIAFLAGGQSSRMGTPKALLTLEGETFLQRQARIFSGFSRRLLSSNDPRIRLDGVRRVEDAFPGMGPMGGIYSVLKACNSPRIFFLPCDMPLMTVEALQRLVHGLGDGAACIATLDGRPQPLGAVYTPAVLPALEQCLAAGSYRLGAMLSQVDCRKVAIEDEAGRRAFININTPEELSRLQRERNIAL